MNKIILILVSVFLGSLGQVLLKVGAGKLGSISFAHAFGDILRIFMVPQVLIGLVFFGSSFLLWVKVLTDSELSYAYPMVSLGYVVVAVLSYFLFHESFTFNKIFGMMLIIAGVLAINR